MAVRIGCVNDHLPQFESWLGRAVDSVRIYSGSDSPPSGAWATCRNLSNAGYYVSMSFHALNSMASVISGAEDARVHSIAAFLEGLPVGGSICFEHEFENNTAGVSGATFKQAASRVIGILNAEAPSWQTMYIFLGGFRDSRDGKGQVVNNQFTGPPPSQWWPFPNQPKLMGVDWYDWRQAAPAGSHFANASIPHRYVGDLKQLTSQPNTLAAYTGAGSIADFTGVAPPLFNSYIEFAQSLTPIPHIHLPEFGVSIVSPGNQANRDDRRFEIQQFADMYRDHPLIDEVDYFDIDDNGGTQARVNWRLSGGNIPADPTTAVAYDSISQGGIIIPPPPDFLPGVIPVQIRPKIGAG